MDARALQALGQLNRRINQAILPIEDRDDRWTIGAHAGDCEDYALTKRAALLAAGWEPSQLLIAVVEDPFAGPHAVLIARTSLGDYILDNLTDRVERWDETSLSFLSRQSARMPALWVRL